MLNNMKKVNVYGIYMTTLEQMRFYKYLDIERIAMNTYSKIDRQQITQNWLNHGRLKL